MLTTKVYLPFVLAGLSISDTMEHSFQTYRFSKLGYEHMVNIDDTKYPTTMEYNYIHEDIIIEEFIHKYQNIIYQ